MPSQEDVARTEWRTWYARHGRRVISTRDWQTEERFFSSGLRDLDVLVREFGLPAGGTVHEIGCGPGRLTRHLQERFDRVTANDVCDEAVVDCRRVVGEHVVVTVGGAETLESLPAAGYDCVVSIATLQHVADPSEVLRYVGAAARLLKPSGMAVMQVSGDGWRRKLHDGVIDTGRWIGSPVTKAPPVRGPNWRGCALDERALLAAARGRGHEGVVRPDGWRYRWVWIHPS